MDTVLETRGITKKFPGVTALDNVSIRINAGSCHALVGENGAGKSTLGKILAGLCQADEGQIVLKGAPTFFGSPIQAMKSGVGLVHQELAFCENLTVAENLCLDRLPNRFGFLDRKEMIARAKGWLEAVGADISPNATVGELPIGKQQLVQIAGALGRGSSILIFDEPTSSLTQSESDRLFAQIRLLQAKGVTCIYISHRLEEVLKIAQEVSVLRDGKHVGTYSAGDLTRDKLVQLMIGRDLMPFRWRALALGEPALKISGLSSPRKFADVSLTLCRGEVLGVAGLVGSGRTQILEALFGLDPCATGIVEVHGRRASIRSPREALSLGIGFVPEDRKRQGLVLSMNARENISLPTLDTLATLTWISQSRERALAEESFAKMRVKATGIDAATAALSGGNQQKLVIAKWLAARSDILLLDEPTRGVDVGAKAEIYEIIRDAAASGTAVLLVSSDLPELLALSTRIAVLHCGRLVGELPRQEATEESVMRLMTNVRQGR